MSLVFITEPTMKLHWPTLIFHVPVHVYVNIHVPVPTIMYIILYTCRGERKVRIFKRKKGYLELRVSLAPAGAYEPPSAAHMLLLAPKQITPGGIKRGLYV